MHRTIKLTISYDGANYVGWQRQPNGESVQGRIEDALAKMTGKRTAVTAAGRTDAGVHALAQVAHFVTSSKIPCHGFIAGLNSMLPDDIAILAAEDAASGFNARRDAKGKIYRYRLFVSRIRSPLLLGRCWQVRGPLDLAAMKKAAAVLVGEHDFASFRAAGCGSRHAKRRIMRIAFKVSAASKSRCDAMHKGRIIDIEFHGDGFVRHMIRNIAGTLVDVGEGRKSPDDIAQILTARKREQAGRCAPACGLYLVEVLY